MSSKIIAVTGATGQQGGSVARELIKSGYRVRALTRNPKSPAAGILAEAGAEVVQAEFTDPSSLVKALSGVDAFYLMTTPFEAGTEAETAQGIVAVESALTAGVPYIVFSSVGDADRATGIPHFDSKYEVEKVLKSSGIPHSIIAPAFFYENMMAPFVLPGLKDGTFAQALPANRGLQMVSLRTIGSLTALALTDRPRFEGKRINLAGDEVNGVQVADILGNAAGRKITYTEVPLDAVMSQSEDMGVMYKWFNEVGYTADIAGLKAEYPEADWISFKDWAASVEWSALM